MACELRKRTFSKSYHTLKKWGRTQWKSSSPRLVDEVAELAAKLLRPTLAISKEADLEDTEAFLVCIRIGLTQARHWEQSEDAWLYDAPVEIEPESLSTELEILKATKNWHSSSCYSLD